MNRFKIGLLNAAGLNRSPDEVVNECHRRHVDIILLTETYHTSGNLFTDWQQFHTYALIPGNALRGFGGLSLLARPDLPFHIHHLPTDSPYVLSVRIGQYTIHGLYLPPSLSIDEYNRTLASLSIDDKTIILGDLNTRMRILLGDERDNRRRSHLQSWVFNFGLNVWNAELAYGIPT
ncbi:Endonuclease/exonuclease/phosphatase, partial [Syncephalastrum racemosum]